VFGQFYGVKTSIAPNIQHFPTAKILRNTILDILPLKRREIS